MKKIKNIILLLVVVALCLLPLVSCNQQIFDMNYTYTRAYLKIDDKWIDIPISKWCNY